MKRLFTLLFFIFQFALLNSQNWKLSVEPIFGMKYGEVDEYVFLKKCDYDDDKLSELNWEIKPELYVGGKINGGWKKIFGEMTFTAGIPMKTGEMIDSDWLNVEKKNAEDFQYKTNYSESDNYLKYDFLFGIKAGYEFDIFENRIVKINIKPNVGFDYKKIYFNGKNGYAWYGSTSDNHYLPYKTATTPTYDFSGKDVIDYSRQSYITWFGFDSTFTFFEKFDANLGFQISPYIYAESIDIHYLNNAGKGTAYLDATTGYFKTLKWNIGASYKINSRNTINISASWFYMGLLRGDDYSQSYSNYKKNKNFDPNKTKSTAVDGGAAEHYFDLSLSYRFKIF